MIRVMLPSRRFSLFFFSTALLFGMLLLTGCQPAESTLSFNNVPSPPSVNSFNSPTVPPVERGTTAPAFPAVPTILPKPELLGPVYPGIIHLASWMKEPWIRVRITQESTTPPYINPRLYRGTIKIAHLPDGKYAAINSLPIESYLAGVLSRELYANWQPATYRAQAIAARTYALYQIETFGRTHAWDVTGGQNSQVYGGKNAETPRAWQAVRATIGEVMETRDQQEMGIFCAFYSACNGGASQSAADAWGDPSVPPLTNHVFGTLDANCPKFIWPTITLSLQQITQAVTWWGQKNKIPYLAELGPVASVRITQRNAVTHRPMIITLIDVAGHIGKMRAEEFRLALALDPMRTVPAPPSSFFDIQRDGNNIELVNGHGFGHGIGLSQWGAQTLALRGWRAESILQLYYPHSWIHKEW
jgi:stage II sporulation protein D